MTAAPGWDHIIEQWRSTAPWKLPEHVLQDLVLSRVIVEFANDKRLRRSLVLHGGSCLHKIWLDRPQRYSEDLDFLCVKPWHLPFAMRRMKRIVAEAGVADAHFDFMGYPSLVGSQIDGRTIDLKIDFNPTPRASQRALRNRSSQGSLVVESDWYRGQTTLIPCVSAVDILASKIAAIMTRAKARDLADLTLGIESGIASASEVVAAYREHYRSTEHPRMLRPRVDALMSDDSFRHDLGADSDFMPNQFTPDSMYTAVATIDSQMARHS